MPVTMNVIVARIAVISHHYLHLTIVAGIADIARLTVVPARIPPVAVSTAASSCIFTPYFIAYR